MVASENLFLPFRECKPLQGTATSNLYCTGLQMERKVGLGWNKVTDQSLRGATLDS